MATEVRVTSLADRCQRDGIDLSPSRGSSPSKKKPRSDADKIDALTKIAETNQSQITALLDLVLKQQALINTPQYTPALPSALPNPVASQNDPGSHSQVPAVAEQPMVVDAGESPETPKKLSKIPQELMDSLAELQTAFTKDISRKLVLENDIKRKNEEMEILRPQVGKYPEKVKNFKCAESEWLKKPMSAARTSEYQEVITLPMNCSRREAMEIIYRKCAYVLKRRPYSKNSTSSNRRHQKVTSLILPRNSNQKLRFLLG